MRGSEKDDERPTADKLFVELRADAYGVVRIRARSDRGQRPPAPQAGRALSQGADTILIDRRITYTRKRCTLVHELVHWRHGDDTTHGCLGGKNERRCRRETAMLLINSAEYALAERMYDGNPYQMAAELNVTVQVVEDYKDWLHDSVVV